jgi:hypothetical protein
MKFCIALFIVCGSLSMNAMNDDKKVGGGVSGASKKEQVAHVLTLYDCPAGGNPSLCLARITDKKILQQTNNKCACVESKRPNSGHMNF